MTKKTFIMYPCVKQNEPCFAFPLEASFCTGQYCCRHPLAQAAQFPVHLASARPGWPVAGQRRGEAVMEWNVSGGLCHGDARVESG